MPQMPTRTQDSEPLNLKTSVAGLKTATLPKITLAFEFSVLTLTVPGLRLRKVQNPVCFWPPAPFSSSLTTVFRLKAALHSLACFLSIGCHLALHPVLSEAQTFDEILQSRELQKIDRQHTPRREIYDADPTSNFASIWKGVGSPKLLLTWLGVTSTRYRATEPISGIFSEYAGANIRLRDKTGVFVRLDVQVPKPSYWTMAKLKTLASFNRFRPPTLDVIAEQVIPMHGLDANYYRTRKGECSLLFNIERMGIVNLSTHKCADSRVMMDIAKSLDFTRLNQKLTS